MFPTVVKPNRVGEKNESMANSTTVQIYLGKLYQNHVLRSFKLNNYFRKEHMEDTYSKFV